MILSTVPGMVALGCSGMREVSRFSSATLADLAMRGFAISLLTLARVALADSFFDFLCGMHPYWHRDASHAVPFRTVAKRSTGKEGDHETDGRLRSSILSTRVVLLERSVTLASSVFEFCATQDLNYTTGVFDGVLLPQNTSCAA